MLYVWGNGDYYYYVEALKAVGLLCYKKKW